MHYFFMKRQVNQACWSVLSLCMLITIVCINTSFFIPCFSCLCVCIVLYFCLAVSFGLSASVNFSIVPVKHGMLTLVRWISQVGEIQRYGNLQYHHYLLTLACSDWSDATQLLTSLFWTTGHATQLWPVLTYRSSYSILTCSDWQVMHSKTSEVHTGFMVLTRTTVPITLTNFPEHKINKETTHTGRMDSLHHYLFHFMFGCLDVIMYVVTSEPEY